MAEQNRYTTCAFSSSALDFPERHKSAPPNMAVPPENNVRICVDVDCMRRSTVVHSEHITKRRQAVEEEMLALLNNFEGAECQTFARSEVKVVLKAWIYHCGSILQHAMCMRPSAIDCDLPESMTGARKYDKFNVHALLKSRNKVCHASSRAKEQFSKLPKFGQAKTYAVLSLPHLARGDGVRQAPRAGLDVTLIEIGRP